MNPTKPTLDDLRIERREKTESSGRFWTVVIILMVLALGATAYWWLTRPKTFAVRTVAARAVTGQNGERTVLNASGYVTARREATVSSKVTGKVVEVLVEEGMQVKAGQILARLDDTNIKTSLRLVEAQLDSAKSALAEIRVRIREADQELRRQTDLLKAKIATQADFDHAEAALLALQARLQLQQSDIIVAERQVANWQQQLDDTIIRAPFTGVVTSKNAQPGEMISPISAGGGFTRTGICTIVDMDSLEIEIDVNESYINRVTSGQPVIATLDAYSDWKIPCKVIATIPTADRQKSTVRVRVGFDQLDSRILPQMSVKVAFRDTTSTNSTAIRLVGIPKSGLRQQDGQDVVMVAQGGRAERRAVTVSGILNEEATISAGLTAGERIIIDGSKELKDGATIKEVQP